MASKKLNKILLILVVFIAVVFFCRNIIIKTVVQTAFKKVTGLPLEIGSIKSGLLSTNFHIQDFKIMNPEGYNEKVMMEIPEVFVDYHLGSILAGKIHVEEFRFHLKEFNVVKKADGTSNLDSFKALQEAQGSGAKKPKKEKEDAPKEKQEIQIDNLTLKIDQAQTFTYKEDQAPVVKTFKIGLNEEHKDIKSLNSLLLMMVLKIVIKAPAIATAGNIDVGILGSVVSGSLGKATELLNVGTGAATEVLGGAKGALTETKGKLKGLLGGN